MTESPRITQMQQGRIAVYASLTDAAQDGILPLAAHPDISAEERRKRTLQTGTAIPLAIQERYPIYNPYTSYEEVFEQLYNRALGEVERKLVWLPQLSSSTIILVPSKAWVMENFDFKGDEPMSRIERWIRGQQGWQGKGMAQLPPRQTIHNLELTVPMSYQIVPASRVIPRRQPLAQPDLKSSYQIYC